MPDKLNQLEMETFAECRARRFRLEAGEGAEPVALELADVSPMGGKPAKGSNRRPFSVVFRAPEGQEGVLPQQIYRLDNEELGELELFLVPLGPDEDGRMEYEAVFT